MKQYTFPYGRGVQTVLLPEDHVAYELKGTGAAPVADVTKAVQKALRRVYPKDALSERVAPYEKVVIVVSDGTRMVYTPQMLDAVIGELHTIGVADEQITLLVALGTHRPATKRELTEICGSWANRLRVVQHDCRDKTQLAYVGTTPEGNAVYLNRLAVEADKVILTGGISFHDMAGFSGGRKAVLPGLAGYDTIMRNHALALNAEDIGGRNRCCDAARLEGNPMHEDMVEGTLFIEPDFMVNTVLGADGAVIDVVAGHWLTDWQDGCRLLLAADSVAIPQKADVTIASAGGYPKDINFYQATKAHMNAVFATKPGGIMILVMECPDISEPPEFAKAFGRRDTSAAEQDLRQHFTIGAFSAYKTQEIIESMRAVFVVTERKNFDIMKQSGQIPVESLEEAWQAANAILAEDGKEDYTIALMPYAASTLPVIKKTREEIEYDIE